VATLPTSDIDRGVRLALCGARMLPIPGAIRRKETHDLVLSPALADDLVPIPLPCLVAA
jgi:hypothetical protein